MSIDYGKSAIVPMMNRRSGEVEFELLIYGYSASELMSVPNPVIGSLAQRYPDHQSSPFLIRDNTRKRRERSFFVENPRRMGKTYAMERARAVIDEAHRTGRPEFKDRSEGLIVRGIRDEDALFE